MANIVPDSLVPLNSVSGRHVRAMGYDGRLTILAVLYDDVIHYFYGVPLHTYQAFAASLTPDVMFLKVIVRDYCEFDPYSSSSPFGRVAPDKAVVREYCEQIRELQLEYGNQRREIAKLKDDIAAVSTDLDNTRMLYNSARRNLNRELESSASHKRWAYISTVLLIFACVVGVLFFNDGFQSSYNSGYSAGYSSGREHTVSEQSPPASSSESSGGKRSSNSASSSAPKASAPPSLPDSSAELSDTVYVTATGTKYHRAGCGYLKSSRALSLEDAIAAGYTPCSRCW